jgi:glycerophosphoryl diester phosphodiesterase
MAVLAPITFAHRGGRADVPENTLPAFRRALSLGASGLESDARLSGDHQVVLVHDATVRRGLRRIRVAALPAAELAELGVPRLTDLYAELGSGYELSLDLREPEVAGPVLEVARAQGALGRLWLCSSDVEVLGRVHQADRQVRLVHSARRRGYGDALERHAAGLAREGVAALNLHETQWSMGVVALAHRFGLLAFAWDVREARRIHALLGMGIDGVYSDYVERMVATVGEWTRTDTG